MPSPRKGKGGGKSPRGKSPKKGKGGGKSPKKSGRRSPSGEDGGGSRRDPRAQEWADEQWKAAESAVYEQQDKIEQRIAEGRSIGVDTYRERRALGLARARAITSERTLDGGTLSIPLLLLSNDEEAARIRSGELSEWEKARVAEALEDANDTRSAREIIEDMETEGRLPVFTGALPTAAWPASNRVGSPNTARAAAKPTPYRTRFDVVENVLQSPRVECSGRYTLTAATTA